MRHIRRIRHICHIRHVLHMLAPARRPRPERPRWRRPACQPCPCPSISFPPSLPPVLSVHHASTQPSTLNPQCLAGGSDGEIVLDTVESWDVRGTGGWRTEPSLRCARSNLAACTVHDRLYAVGGWDGRRELPAVESFRLGSSNRWRREAPLDIPRSNLAVAVLWQE